MNAPKHGINELEIGIQVPYTVSISSPVQSCRMMWKYKWMLIQAY